MILHRRHLTDGGVQSNQRSATGTSPGQDTAGKQERSANATTMIGESLPGLSRSSRILSLRWRLTIPTTLVMVMSVRLITLVAFFTVQIALYCGVGNNFCSQTKKLLMPPYASEFAIGPSFETGSNGILDPDLDVVYFTHGSVAGKGGGSISISGPELAVLRGNRQESTRTDECNGHRVYAVRSEDGATLILLQDLSLTQSVSKTLDVVLLSVPTIGIFSAVGLGITVVTTSLHPVIWLRTAVERTTKIDELRPTPMEGDDEPIRFTRSLNEILAVLQALHIKQAESVVDAGHELKTPLASLHTNIESLMMASRLGAAVSDEDRADLEANVITQLEELSVLVGDLVNLVCEDGPQQVIEHVDIDEIISMSLVRIERRRPNITFDVQTAPWHVYGDSAGLGHAILNLMDNAAKWPPENGTMRVRLTPLSEVVAEFMVVGSGPGISEEDRDRIFERFYRSIQSCSMPGSGLDLAIVKSAITRRGGTITTDESDDGGVLMRVTPSGSPHSGKDEDSGPA